MEERQIAQIFKALGDVNRVHILKILQNGERCACELLRELDVTQPTLSHHMKILCESGIVNARKEGTWMHYTISAEGAKIAQDALKQLTTVRCSRKVKSCCEK